MIDNATVRQYITAIIASLGFVLQGTSLGWPSPTLVKLEQTGQPMRLDDNQKSWMVSALYIGNFLSPIPSGYLMDMFGRKRTLCVLSCVPLVGWILVLVATNPTMLYVSRLLNGLWTGIANTIIPTYLGEIADPSIRGALSTLVQIMTFVGVLIEYIVGPFVSYNVLAILNIAIPVVFLLLLLCVPESPYWYTMKGKSDEANKTLRWLRGTTDSLAVEKEMTSIEQSVKEEMKNKKHFKDLVATRGNRKGLLIVQTLAIIQRMSGISGLMAYTAITLPKEGIDPDDCVIVMGIVWMLSSMSSMVIVDVLGRKPLLIASTCGGGFAMAATATWFYLRQETTVDTSSIYWAPFAGLLVYGFFFSIGLGPLSTTVQSEMFPSNTKALSSAITSISLGLTSFIMNKIYLTLASSIGMYVNFVIFSSACFLGLLFVIFYVIETKGKTLQEIQEKLNA